MKALILYSELAGYNVSCLNQAIEHSNIEEIHVVRFPVNEEAPFQFTFKPGIHDYTISNYSRTELFELANNINPDVIFCSGWINKDYLAVCKSYFRKIPTVLTMDNHWKGTAKQRVLKLLSKFTLLNKFSHIWVPGKPQKTYAQILGFDNGQIETGFYSADLSNFNEIYDKSIDLKAQEFPKKFICVARYIPAKGLVELWNAFIKLKKEVASEWELWCLGAGDEYENRIEFEGIKHFGFIQPDDMLSFIRKTGVFVLPSNFEPWGVSVHEFAAAGFPLVLSTEVGSSGTFLEEKFNGFTLIPGDVESIYLSLKEITTLSDSELLEMGKRSHELAQKITQETWIEKFISFKL